MALSPDQISDLRRSGLTDDTITRMHCEGVRPKEIPIKSATSAYAIPYFRLDGTLNCFSRLKFVPEVVDAQGRKMKYWQPPDSSPHLYLAPLLGWQNVARHSTTELVITEGEKKAAAACQHGLTTAGIGGVWCWRSTLDNGDTLTLPMLDEFQWPNRSVLICPDSDAWHEGKEMQILAGFFALAKDLQQRRASVQFVMLPDIHGAKAGLDDWLLVPGHDVEQSWPKLERLTLDDPRFSTLAAWWQKWKEKQATHEAIKQNGADELVVTEVAGHYTVRSPKHSVSITFERLTDARDSVYAEVAIVIGATEILSGCKLGLQSDSGQGKLAGSLKAVAVSVPWKILLQRACSLVLKHHRQGEPIITLIPSASATVPFLLNPIIYQGHQTLIYAPGGSCKSYLALFFALVACHGGCHAGVAGLKVSVLYLDWELNAETLGGRLKALQAGHPEFSRHTPFYRRCELPLHQEAHTIAAFVAEHHVKLVIVDSAAMACGAELSSPEAAITLQRALRKINCASLVLAHTSKSVVEGQERTAFGTVFFRELARNVWELSKADEEHPVTLALSHTKHNFSSKHPPLGFRLTFSPEQVRVDAEDLANVPALQKKLATPSRIRNLLEDGRLRTAKGISDDLDIPLSTVKSALSRGKGHKWQQVGEDYHDPQWTVLRSK
ncbi:MAG: DUF3854 domain-containing protein [Nitrospira sp.]|nr:MAG: DUF3854 domain-containing protein [Nitrospira sp.]